MNTPIKMLVVIAASIGLVNCFDDSSKGLPEQEAALCKLHENAAKEISGFNRKIANESNGVARQQIGQERLSAYSVSYNQLRNFIYAQANTFSNWVFVIEQINGVGMSGGAIVTIKIPCTPSINVDAYSLPSLVQFFGTKKKGDRIIADGKLIAIESAGEGPNGMFAEMGMQRLLTPTYRGELTAAK